MDNEFFANEIERLKQINSFRVLRNLEYDGVFVKENGKRMLNFSSNDYLGLASDTGLKEEFLNNSDTGAMGSSSSRLLTGNHKAFIDLEYLLASSYKREAALVLNSGYHTNIGILPAIADKQDIIIADKLVHASIIDGSILSGAQVVRYKHNDYKHLEKLLEKHSPVSRNTFIVTESIFSMDGDLADLNKLVGLKNYYKAFLYVDEAHAVGVRGGQGLGLAEELNLIHEIDFLVGTFGKAYASMGAFVICDAMFRDYLINKMRPLIFSTAIPPILVEWSKFVFTKTLEMKDERNKLLELSADLFNGINRKGFASNTKSQIIPLILGENSSCVKLSEYLNKNGFYVLPVRAPAVPEGTARLRFSLTAGLNTTDINKILDLIPNIEAL